MFGDSKVRKKPTERQFHVAVVDFLRLALTPQTVFCHAPGEGRRGWHGQADLRQLGYYTGWPDLGVYHGGHAFFMELKARDGYVPPVQVECHQRLRDAGCPVEIVRTLEEVKHCLKVWGIPAREVRV